MPKKKTRILQWIDSNWVITLFSTMFGVIFGLYLTNYFENKSLENERSKAFNQVQQEIAQNEELLHKHDSVLRLKFNSFKFLSRYISDDFKIEVEQSVLDSFLIKTDAIFIKEEIIELNNKNVQLKGEANLYFESGLMINNLADVIWNSYKQTEYMKVTTFDCVTNIESIYQLQKDINYYNNQFRSQLFEKEFLTGKQALTRFINIWEALMLKQSVLLQMYRVTGQTLEVCK